MGVEPDDSAIIPQAMKASTLANGAETRATGAKSPSPGTPVSPRRSARRVSHDAPVAEDRRQGDPAQERRQGLLPDQRRGARGAARRGRTLLRPGYDWFFPYYATARSAWRSASRRATCSWPRSGRGRPGQRRAADAVALEQPAAQHSLAEQLRRHALPARRRLRRGGPHLQPRRGHRIARDAVPRRPGDLRLDRRRRHERRRVLGIAEHRMHEQAAGALPGRGQRLRHLGAGRGADARWRHLADREQLSRSAGLPLRRHRLPRSRIARSRRRLRTSAPARARRSCTPRSPGPTRTRTPTTSTVQDRRPSARPKRGGIR